MKEFKIVPIRNGTVIDHLEPGKSLQVLDALGFPVEGASKVISLSMNLPSGKAGLKDVLKLEDVELTDAEVEALKTISSRGTLVIIRNYDVAEKVRWGDTGA